MKRLIILVAALLFFTNCSNPKQNNNQQVLVYLEKEMKENSIPGLQIAVIKNNELILSKSLGLANVPFYVQTQKHTIFSINSIAKIFASTAIMQLTEKGKIQINQQISNYLDGLPVTWQ